MLALALVGLLAAVPPGALQVAPQGVERDRCTGEPPVTSSVGATSSRPEVGQLCRGARGSSPVTQSAASRGTREAKSSGRDGIDQAFDSAADASVGSYALADRRADEKSRPSNLRRGELLTPEGVVIDRAEFADHAERADFILIGESHASRCDHLMQASLIAGLAHRGLSPTVGLEAIPVDQRAVIDLFNQGRIEPQDLGKALAWPTIWGFDYGLYEPVFQVARRFELPVAALNVPKNVVRMVLDGKVKPAEVKPRWLLPRVVILAPPAQEPELRRVFEEHRAFGHGKQRGRRDRGTLEEEFERFVLAQSLWDSKMALEAIDAHKKHGSPVVILAGVGHVEHGWGVPHRLQVLAPEARVLTVLPWRGGEQPEAGAADLFFYCPMDQDD
ncbi:MAG: ChaN family lipoprotein [Myxococcales bacterium]|jgi:uncharacterized iron-regulated protein